MKITILCISDSDKDYKTIIQEYQKRLGKEVNIVELKPEKSGERSKIIQKETDLIIKSLDKNSDFKVLLSIWGDDLDTMQFKDMIYQNNNIVFIIWWPYWLDEARVSKFIDTKISFWKMTLPHLLARTVLLEQIYRAKTIIWNKNYHY